MPDRPSMPPGNALIGAPRGRTRFPDQPVSTFQAGSASVPVNALTAPAAGNALARPGMVNLLTGTVIQPGSSASAAPPSLPMRSAAMTAAAPQPQIPVQPQAAAPAEFPGQEKSNQALRTIAPSQIPDADLANRVARSTFVQNAARGLLAKKDLSHADVVDVVANAIKGGLLPTDEASHVLASFPTDPAKLRPALENLHINSLHAAIHLAGEQQKRGPAA